MNIKQNKLTLALATLMSSTALVSCGGSSPSTNVGSAPTTPLTSGSTITKTQDNSLTISSLNTNTSLVSSVSTSGDSLGYTSGVMNNKLTNVSSQGNSSRDAFGVSIKNNNSATNENPNATTVSVKPGILLPLNSVITETTGTIVVSNSPTASQPSTVATNSSTSESAPSNSNNLTLPDTSTSVTNTTRVTWASTSTSGKTTSTETTTTTAINNDSNSNVNDSNNNSNNLNNAVETYPTNTAVNTLNTVTSTNTAKDDVSNKDREVDISTTSNSARDNINSNVEKNSPATTTVNNFTLKATATRTSTASTTDNSNKNFISVNVPNINLGNINIPSLNKPVVNSFDNTTTSSRVAEKSNCDPNICNAISKEPLATESVYASLELASSNSGSSNSLRNYPVNEYFNGRLLSDSAKLSNSTIYKPGDSQLKATGYTGFDYQPKSNSWNLATGNYSGINYYSYPLNSDSLEINNPAHSFSAYDLLINGSQYLYGSNLHKRTNYSGATINELLFNRIVSGSTNITSNYRNFTTASLQNQVGNNYSASNPANFKSYSIGDSSFINTYISLEPARRINLAEYNPSQNKGINTYLAEKDLETSSNLLSGRGVKVAVVDLPVNKYHPLLSGRVNYYADVENAGALADIRLRYKLQTGYDLPINHGTEVALVLGAQQNPLMKKYQGLAPQVKINSYEYILDTTRLANTFKRLKADGNSIVNASFTFGRRDKENNKGVLDELRTQALDWKNAPLYIFSSGNNEKSTVKNTITGTLSDLVMDSAVSPITMVVTGATTDQQLINAGYTGVNSLNLSPHAIACGISASNCITGFFMNTVSDPELDISNSRFYYNDLNYQLGNDSGKNVYGTSFATPQVTATAALVKQMFPWMTANNLRQTILTTATDIGEPGIDSLFGWGLVNVGNAVKGPAAFAFGDYVVNIDYDALRNQPGTNLNHWWFTNNIIGKGGLTYSNNSPYSLILTGNNTYSGSTKVLNGRIILFNSNSDSPFEISANGAVNVNTNSNINAPVQNFGYVQVLNSSLKQGLVNQGTANLMNANIEGDVTLGDNALLRNSGVSHISGSLNLVNQSVFVTDLQSLLKVNGTAKLDGAIGVQKLANYVPEDGKLYQIISAGKFDPTFRRFTKVYSALRDDLSLVNFDLVYDDNNANVYVHYFQNRNKTSNLSNVIADKLASTSNNLHETINSGAENINRVLQSAARDYVVRFEKLNVTEPVYSYVYSQNSSYAVEKKLLADLVSKYPNVTAKDNYLGFMPFVDDDGLSLGSYAGSSSDVAKNNVTPEASTQNNPITSTEESLKNANNYSLANNYSSTNSGLLFNNNALTTSKSSNKDDSSEVVTIKPKAKTTAEANKLLSLEATKNGNSEFAGNSNLTLASDNSSDAVTNGVTDLPKDPTVTTKVEPTSDLLDTATNLQSLTGTNLIKAYVAAGASVYNDSFSVSDYQKVNNTKRFGKFTEKALATNEWYYLVDSNLLQQQWRIDTDTLSSSIRDYGIAVGVAHGFGDKAGALTLHRNYSSWQDKFTSLESDYQDLNLALNGSPSQTNKTTKFAQSDITTTGLTLNYEQSSSWGILGASVTADIANHKVTRSILSDSDIKADFTSYGASAGVSVKYNLADSRYNKLSSNVGLTATSRWIQPFTESATSTISQALVSQATSQSFHKLFLTSGLSLAHDLKSVNLFGNINSELGLTTQLAGKSAKLKFKNSSTGSIYNPNIIYNAYLGYDYNLNDNSKLSLGVTGNFSSVETSLNYNLGVIFKY